uniref:TBC1 domain family member 31 n=1 Tax=Anopheles farauti TaxID=69004 RepID=A0A182QXN3_9DIPT
MDVNAGNFDRRNGGKATFKFNSTNDGVLLNIHHTVRNQADGTVRRIRFTVAGFSANNERLFAVDHRDNVFVFDLVRQCFWKLSFEQIRKLTVVEGLADGTSVALGNKEGIVWIVDLGENGIVRQLKAHPRKIVHLAQSHAFDSKPAQACSDQRYLLVASSDAAKVYSMHDFTELSSISYGLACNNSFRPNTWHWYRAPNGPALISHSACGSIRAYRVNLKLTKELNAVRLIELYLKHTPPQTISFGVDTERTVNPSGGFSCAGPGRLTTAQLTADGRYYVLLYGPSTVVFLALDSWVICRVVAFVNLFITHATFVPVQPAMAKPATTYTLTVRTTDNDLMLVNFGCYGTTTNPPRIQPLTVRPESKCYKYALAPNGRILANVLSSGEVLLHGLDSYRGDYFSSGGIGKVCAKGKLAPPACGKSSSSGGVAGNAVLRSSREIKIEQQINLSETLPKNRLWSILKEYGEYPSKYRTIIWRTLQQLPNDAESFGALLQRGPHPCVAGYDERFAGYDQRTVRSVKKTVSALAHWCPVFGLIDYIPSMVLPFARHQPNDALGLFETVATVLLNQCQLWFEFAPLEPFNYLAMVENVLAECEPRLMGFYRRHNIASRSYALPLMQTGFGACCNTDVQWLTLWDHVLSNEPYFAVFLIAAYSSIHRSTLLAATHDASRTIDSFFAHHQHRPVDVRRLVRRAYELMERCSGAAHPRHYFKSFMPLNAPTSDGGKTYRAVPEQLRVVPREWSTTSSGSMAKTGGSVFPNAANNAIDFTSSSTSSSSRDGCRASPSPSSLHDDQHPSCGPVDRSSTSYASFSNFPKKLTEARCTVTNALQKEQRRLEAKIIELEKLEHSLQERMVNDLVRQEHQQRVKEVERNLEAAIAREEQRVEMQRKLLLLHRKQLRERESELSHNVHNAKLINDATVRERELDALLSRFERERQREETDLLFAEEDIKLRELELLERYRGAIPTVPSGPAASDERPLDQRYQVALEQLAVQKLKLYDEIDRTYSTLGMPAGVNEYTYRTVSELRKVASHAGGEQSRSVNRPAAAEQPTQQPRAVVMDRSKYTSQVLSADGLGHCPQLIETLRSNDLSTASSHTLGDESR